MSATSPKGTDGVRRRAVLAALAALAGARLAAQPMPRPLRIGFLGNTGGYNEWDLRPLFAAGMRELGWNEGTDYTVDSLHADGHGERLPALAAGLVQHKPGLIIASGTPPAVALKRATATIPIVFFYVGDPVASGLVESLARPGGNVTGLGGIGRELHTKQFDLLRQTVPNARRIAVFKNDAIAFHGAALREVETAAQHAAVAVQAIDVPDADRLDAAFAAAAPTVGERADALHIFGQPLYFAHAQRVAALALKHRLPAMIPFGFVVRAGLLMSYAGDVEDDVKRLPTFIHRIAMGTRPADLPVEQPLQFYLRVNLKTARALNLSVPSTVLLQAREVIE